ncbi:hypothetical protein RvY_16891 [Ramazzottius varieornatus]|uniref:Uncharacterized protein n=1 Tax=Ramazzottius varieornatus TaxID=947166 RepID=A0A1D1W035_RAMVA|nr:hypothetical protein RvY_16891 [Ramazzottius varieornatus]
MSVQYRLQARTALCPPRRRTGLSLIFARGRGKRIRLTYTLLMPTLIDGVLWKSWDIVGAMYPIVYAQHPMASLLSRTSIAVVSVLAPTIICLANSDFRKGLTHCISPWPRILPQTTCHSRRVIEPSIHHLPTVGHGQIVEHHQIP